MLLHQNHFQTIYRKLLLEINENHDVLNGNRLLFIRGNWKFCRVAKF